MFTPTHRRSQRRCNEMRGQVIRCFLAFGAESYRREREHDDDTKEYHVERGLGIYFALRHGLVPESGHADSFAGHERAMVVEGSRTGIDGERLMEMLLAKPAAPPQCRPHTHAFLG